MMPRSILDVPLEVLQKIVQYASLASPLGPPAELASLLSTCRSLYIMLHPNSGDFYLNIFAQKFDITGPISRLGYVSVRDHAQLELHQRFSALKLFKEEHIDHPELTGALWMAYVMLRDCEDNSRQLLWAGLPSFLRIFIREHLYQGADSNHGWPIWNPRNCLALTLWWLLCSQSLVNVEERDEILLLLAPFVFAAFRYPIFDAHECIFEAGNVSIFNVPTSSTVHGSYPPQVKLVQTVRYFGTVHRRMPIPNAAKYAILLYFIHMETILQDIPPHFLKWKTRLQANLAGHVGPTLEDMHHFTHHCQTKPAKSFSVANTVPRQLDILATDCLREDNPYELGSLTGSWQGSFIMPFSQYKQWMDEPLVPSHFCTTGRQPFYITLQEYFTCDPELVIPSDNALVGARNAWIPTNIHPIKTGDNLSFLNEKGEIISNYQSFRPDENTDLKTKNVLDVIITGKTDDRYTAAWGATYVLGRVRLADGLVILSRECVSGSDTTLMRGYVTSSQNFAGRLKPVSSGAIPADWEAVFSLSKEYGSSPPLNLSS